MEDSLEIGVTAWDIAGPGSAEQYARQGELAERLGFHSFWLPENHFVGKNTLPAPLLLLAVIAARTRHLRLGTGSYLLPIRHPVQIAEEVAVLDRLSEGRVILGVGRGYQPEMFDVFGVPSSEKRRRFDDALRVMRHAWSGGALLDARDADDATPVVMHPAPVQQPHPPIWIAAFGPLALDQAGRTGCPYLASPVESLDRLIENFTRYREAAEEADVLPSPTIAVMRTVFISKDAALVARMRRALESYSESLRASAVKVFAASAANEVDDWTLVGEPSRVRDLLAAYRERLGMTHLVASRNRLPDLDSGQYERSLEQLSLLAEEL
jgi:alkanesulfonate monooxygenase SsuD/methylene tetrahydromethanopterin reductase-like flavin-dependent oxidoreductase (luciferase family)